MKTKTTPEDQSWRKERRKTTYRVSSVTRTHLRTSTWSTSLCGLAGRGDTHGGTRTSGSPRIP